MVLIWVLYFTYQTTDAQDRIGHMKAQKFRQCCSQILSFTVVSRDFVFADIGIIGDYTSLLEWT